MEKKNISIRMILILMFIILMFSTVGIMSFIVFSNWLASANDTFTAMAEEMNDDILRDVEKFMGNPLEINEVNHNAIEYDIINFSDARVRDAFFVNVLQTQALNIYSFSYGLENGEYYGARRNEKYAIEIMRNNQFTNNNSYYYSINEDLTANQLVLVAGKFDPRTRDWYITAKEKGKPTFSKIYKHFILNDLTISAAYPIYNGSGELKGVMGTHMTLTQINDYLKEKVADKKAQAVIFEKDTANLVANSFDQANFVTLDDGSIKRITTEEIDNITIREAYDAYKSTGLKQTRIKTETDKIDVYFTEYNKEGLTWVVMTLIPESIFTTSIIEIIKVSMAVTLLGLFLSGMFFYKLTSVVFKPVEDLIETTEKFANGDLLTRAKIIRNDEIGSISKAFNTMAETINTLVNGLEMKVSERTHALEESNDALEYLSYHDALTGLYNRFYFEAAIKNIDTQENLPIGLIFGDVNGLKLTNDIFGHAAGDTLLKKVSEIMTQVFRETDIIARVGGDEFAVLLPNTPPKEVQNLAEKVKIAFSNERIVGLKGSISIGFDTKEISGKSINEMLKTAEDGMYHDKTINRKNINSELIHDLIATLHDRSIWEKSHSTNVSLLCEKIGQHLGLSQSEIKKLKEAGFLHDIGKVIIDDQIIIKNKALIDAEKELVQQHVVIGFRILNMFDETLDLAESVFAHHERWDGLGYPKGLKGTEIPLLSRIIAVAETYDSLINPIIGSKKSQLQALNELKELAGKNYDPEVVEALVEIIKNNEDKIN